MAEAGRADDNHADLLRLKSQMTSLRETGATLERGPELRQGFLEKYGSLD
jgi:hypothetical protein